MQLTNNMEVLGVLDMHEFVLVWLMRLADALGCAYSIRPLITIEC